MMLDRRTHLAGLLGFYGKGKVEVVCDPQLASSKAAKTKAPFRIL
jgi:hypothetical protein